MITKIKEPYKISRKDIDKNFDFRSKPFTVKNNVMEFNESYPNMIPNMTNLYKNYFDKESKYVLLQVCRCGF